MKCQDCAYASAAIAERQQIHFRQSLCSLLLQRKWLPCSTMSDGRGHCAEQPHFYTHYQRNTHARHFAVQWPKQDGTMAISVASAVSGFTNYTKERAPPYTFDQSEFKSSCKSCHVLFSSKSSLKHSHPVHTLPSPTEYMCSCSNLRDCSDYMTYLPLSCCLLKSFCATLASRHSALEMGLTGNGRRLQT